MSVEAISWALNLAPVPRHGGGKPNPACKAVLTGGERRPPAGPVSRLEIATAVPAGSRRPWDPHQWLSAAETEPELAALRSDARHSALEWARIMARHVDWHDKTVWRLRATMCAEIGSPRDPGRPLSVSAWKAARRFWESHGYIALVRPAWTPELPGPDRKKDKRKTSAPPPPPAKREPGVCPLFVLAVPRSRLPRRCSRSRSHSADLTAHTNRPLAQSRRDCGTSPRTHEASERIKPQPQIGPPSGRTQSLRHQTGAGYSHNGQTFSKESIAAVVRAHDRVLGRLSERHWAWIVARHAKGGWTPGDILYALGHEYGGKPHTWTTPVVHVGAWARWRLDLWADPETGELLPSHSQQLAAAHDARVRRTRAQRAAGILPAEPKAWDDQATTPPVVDLAARAEKIRATPPDQHGRWRGTSRQERMKATAGAQARAARQSDDSNGRLSIREAEREQRRAAARVEVLERAAAIEARAAGSG